MAHPQPTPTQLSNSLTAQSLPVPSISFLTTVLSTTTRLPPERALISLTATAKHRLITSNLTTPQLLSPSTASLPPSLSDVRVVEKLVPTDIFLQIIDVEDLSKSLWEQIEALESERRGETTKGREVIRVIAPTPENDVGSTSGTQVIENMPSASQAVSKGPFKVLMQDWRGGKIYGFENRRVDRIGYPPLMSIGCKLLLKQGAKVARGMVLLDPGSVIIFGGKVEGLDKAWIEGREKSLRERVTKESEERRAGVS